MKKVGGSFHETTGRRPHSGLSASGEEGKRDREKFPLVRLRLDSVELLKGEHTKSAVEVDSQSCFANLGLSRN